MEALPSPEPAPKATEGISREKMDLLMSNIWGEVTLTLLPEPIKLSRDRLYYKQRDRYSSLGDPRSVAHGDDW